MAFFIWVFINGDIYFTIAPHFSASVNRQIKRYMIYNVLKELLYNFNITIYKGIDLTERTKGDETQLCDIRYLIFLPVETSPVPVLCGGIFHHDSPIRVLCGQRRRTLDVLQQRAAKPKLQPNTRLHRTPSPPGAGIHLQPKCLLNVVYSADLCHRCSEDMLVEFMLTEAEVSYYFDNSVL